MSTSAPSRAAGAAMEAWALVRQLWLTNLPGFQALCAEHGLTKPQAGALLQLDPERPVPMSALAGLLMCDASNVTGIVDRLEDRGLVERRDAPHDRRVRMLAVTPEGGRVRARIAAQLGTPPPALTALSPGDQRALRDLLRRAVEHQASAT
jgi:MarR family transcriptional regulator, organic hydroperoxide resistance regulator